AKVPLSINPVSAPSKTTPLRKRRYHLIGRSDRHEPRRGPQPTSRPGRMTVDRDHWSPRVERQVDVAVGAHLGVFGTGGSAGPGDHKAENLARAGGQR